MHGIYLDTRLETVTLRPEGLVPIDHRVLLPAIPQSVAQAVADETGVQLVELQVAQLPDDGTYQDLLRELARQVADALGASGSAD